MAFQMNASGTIQEGKLIRLFNHCLRLSHFPKPWKEAQFTTLPKTAKNPKFPQNLSPISLLATTGKLLQKVILEI
jgi:hypothetical protein